MSEPFLVTTVESMVQLKGRCDRFVFSGTLSVPEANYNAADDNLAESVKLLEGALESVFFDDSSAKESWECHGGVLVIFPDGLDRSGSKKQSVYLTICDFRFTTSLVGRLNYIYGSLSSLRGVKLADIQPFVSNMTSLIDRARTAAVEAALAEFTKQCGALGTLSKEYKVVQWKFDYEVKNPSMYSNRVSEEDLAGPTCDGIVSPTFLEQDTVVTCQCKLSFAAV